MAIDVSVAGSPGWWALRLSKQLADPGRQKRLKLLDDYLIGEPPLPVGALNVPESYRDFQRKATSNFAALIVAAVRERMIPTGFRTSADGDETGDAEAWKVWTRAGLQVTSTDVHTTMLGLSEAYVIVGEVDELTGVPVITAEDPRQVIAATDPANPGRILAALKMFHDDVAGRDLAYVYLPGRVHVAYQKRTRPTGGPARVKFDAKSWTWDAERGGEEGQGLPHDRVPVVAFGNERALGEYETHLPLLDRINHTILQRMVIATMQAFRQRAITGLPDTYPPGHPKAGQEVDYSDMFRADPAALWQLPEGAEMWESGQVELSPILSSVKDDVQHLGIVTRTPFSMLTPEGANQSAEGASLQREGLVYKVEDRIARVTSAWSQVMSLAFLVMGDTERADLTAIDVLWRPPERLSLAERADAASKAIDVPWRTKMIRIWGFPPDEVDRMEAERAADQLAAALSQVQAQRQAGPAPGSRSGSTGSGTQSAVFDMAAA